MAIYNDGHISFKSHITHFENNTAHFRWMNLVRDYKYLTFIAFGEEK